ncbi:MAG: 30S ribosomal protein S10 [Mycoplasma sp.]|nr:30S ribosomal protein S10 [Mycoplasma sp.]
MERVSIAIKAYEVQLVDDLAKKIVELARKEDAAVSGPIPIPTKKELFTVIRSPHISKSSREQFEIRTHKRLIVLTNVSNKLSEHLKKMEVPIGLDIQVKIDKKSNIKG